MGATAEAVAPHGATRRQEVVWRPHQGPQALFLSCPIKDVLYGGARGGGKSAALLMDFAAHAQRHGKHAHGILFRRTYPEFEELERQAEEFYAPLGWSWKGSPHRTWYAPNGATLVLRYLERDADADGYQGHSYTWHGFDEAGNWSSSSGIDRLAATLRSANGVPCVRRLTANPGGPGHAWLKRRYVDVAEPYQAFTSEIGWRSVFIPATIEDNPRLGSDYEQTIKAATFGNEALWQAWRYGSWDVVAGAAFPEWNPLVHVMKAHEIPAHWEIVAGLDWGYRKGAAILMACGPEGQLEVVDAIAVERKTGDEAGRMLAARWGAFRLPVWIAASPDMETSTGTGVTIAEEFRRGWQAVAGASCPLVAGTQQTGSRRTKKLLVHQVLRWTDERDAAGKLQPWALPLLRVHAGCRELIETLPSLPVSPDKPEDDIDTTADDHAYDALGFVLAMRPPKPEALPTMPGPDQHPGFNRDTGHRNPRSTIPDPWQHPERARVNRPLVTHRGSW